LVELEASLGILVVVIVVLVVVGVVDAFIEGVLLLVEAKQRLDSFIVVEDEQSDVVIITSHGDSHDADEYDAIILREDDDGSDEDADADEDDTKKAIDLLCPIDDATWQPGVLTKALIAC